MSGLAEAVKNFPPASEWFHLSPAEERKLRRIMVNDLVSRLHCSASSIRLGVKLSREELRMLAESEENGRKYVRYLNALTDEKFSEFKKLSNDEKLEYLKNNVN